MKTNNHDRTAIGAILVGTAGALALSILFFARAPSPQMRVIEMDTPPEAEAWSLPTVTVGVARRDDDFTPYYEVPVEFTPAMNEGKNIPAWISIPITFEVRQR